MCVSFNLCIVQVEEVPHEFFAFTIIGDFLFGDSPGDFPSYLNQEPRLRQLLSEPPFFWTALVGKYFIERPHVIVSGVNLFYMLLVCIHYKKNCTIGVFVELLAVHVASSPTHHTLTVTSSPTHSQ